MPSSGRETNPYSYPRGPSFRIRYMIATGQYGREWMMRNGLTYGMCLECEPEGPGVRPNQICARCEMEEWGIDPESF